MVNVLTQVMDAGEGPIGTSGNRPLFDPALRSSPESGKPRVSGAARTSGCVHSLGMPELKGTTESNYFMGEEAKWLALDGTLGW